MGYLAVTIFVELLIEITHACLVQRGAAFVEFSHAHNAAVVRPLTFANQAEALLSQPLLVAELTSLPFLPASLAGLKGAMLARDTTSGDALEQDIHTTATAASTTAATAPTPTATPETYDFCLKPRKA